MINPPSSATVCDVAAYILEKQGQMTAMKLQKLVYYAQAWSLVWDDRPLFSNKIKAWANGPVCPDLYGHHKGMFIIDRERLDAGDSNKLDDTAKETIDAVLEFYGDKSAQWLSDLSHVESPWKSARGGAQEGEQSGAEITHAAMAEYYSGIGVVSGSVPTH